MSQNKYGINFCIHQNAKSMQFVRCENPNKFIFNPLSEKILKIHISNNIQ